MYAFGGEGTIPASAASSKRSSKKKELINSKIEKIFKKLDQDRHRNERAVRRALNLVGLPLRRKLLLGKFKSTSLSQARL